MPQATGNLFDGLQANFGGNEEGWGYQNLSTLKLESNEGQGSAANVQRTWKVANG